MGPSATYYFWKKERLALFVGGGISFAHFSPSIGSNSNALVSNLKVGAEYFLIPSVSFGPSVQWTHYFNELPIEVRSPAKNDFSLLGRFSIYF